MGIKGSSLPPALQTLVVDPSPEQYLAACCNILICPGQIRRSRFDWLGVRPSQAALVGRWRNSAGLATAHISAAWRHLEDEEAVEEEGEEGGEEAVVGRVRTGGAPNKECVRLGQRVS